MITNSKEIPYSIIIPKNIVDINRLKNYINKRNKKYKELIDATELKTNSNVVKIKWNKHNNNILQEDTYSKEDKNNIFVQENNNIREDINFNNNNNFIENISSYENNMIFKNNNNLDNYNYEKITYNEEDFGK